MTVQNDRALDIALGTGRKTKTWKNRPTKWSDLLNKLKTTTRTRETVAEYKAMSRERQSEIKDVGGFVGGYCNNGNRSDVRHRSVLCLDADYADGEVWADWELYYGNAAAIYSTHKHTPEKQRLRLIVPLSRDVTPDEYQAIGRRVADTLGIDKFDDTTYQPQRMMYWPSTSSDGAYVFDYIDAPMLDPDTVLATYHDWRDVSSWPMSSRVADIAKRSSAKQQDPTDKQGIVGAFCRAYSIHEAIEAFIPTYEPCTEPGRYTYTEGSTAGGVVTYDDKYAYSHHATDPASGQLCNAWDLVRLHTFKDLDADCNPDTPPSKRPSYKAMQEMALKDKAVKAQVVADRAAEAEAVAADFDEIKDTEDDDSWRSEMDLTQQGGIAQTIGNAVLVLRHDKRLRGIIARDEMTHDIVARKALPWRGKPGQWTDEDDAALRHFMEQHYGLSSKDKIFDAVNIVAQENKFHPVRDYLDGCTWDGVERVDTLLIDYMGADDTPYTRAVTRKTLVAAVARIYRPGCKFDYMLTLRGRQGIGKSAFIGKLGGAWFSDSFTTLQGKEAYEQVQGVWIMEVGELAGMRKAEAETIKLFISKQSDRFRQAYGRRIKDYPRQCIFIGTTNEQQFLRDTTGNRRFWVVDTPNTPRLSIWDLDDAAIRSIWAEAVKLYKDGEPLYLARELEQAAREVQTQYEEDNPKVGLVADYLERLLPEGWETMDTYARRAWLESDAEGTIKRTRVCTMEIWVEALGGVRERLDNPTSREIRGILAGLPEWRDQGGKRITVAPYGRQRYYERSE